MASKKRTIFKSLVMVTQIGISMMTPIAISAFIGYEIDKHLHTGYAFLIMLLLGIGAAFRSFYIITKPFYAKDMEKEHAELKYIQDLKDSRESGEESGPQPDSRKQEMIRQQRRERIHGHDNKSGG